MELVDVTGAGNGGRPGEPATVLAADGLTPAPASVVTSTDGAFAFPLVQPSTYRMRVTPPRGFSFPSELSAAQLPAGRIIDATASYGRDFRLDNRPVRFDLPLDIGGNGGLVVEKRAS